MNLKPLVQKWSLFSGQILTHNKTLKDGNLLYEFHKGIVFQEMASTEFVAY